MKVLIVEDEKRIADNIKKGLELNSMVVDVAYEGISGFDLAMSEDYDVVVLDWMLPEMNGLDICKKLREEGRQTPILMLTAKTEVENKVSGLESGADDYLGKPFVFEELVARIKALARRPKKTMGTILKVDGLSLDLNSYVVKRFGRLINLTKKEYALLEFLMRNKGKVFSSEQLAEQVWGFESDVLPNTVQVYLGYLRNKVDRPFKNKPELIRTVRGFGYKIDEKS